MTGTNGKTANGMLGRIAPAAACLLALQPGMAVAATRAGTSIANTATLSWTDGTAQSVPSNTVALTTAEILDVTLVAERASVSVTSAATVAVGFVATNAGNGGEDFTVATSSNQTGVVATRVAIDSDNDGAYDPAKDQLLVSGAALSIAPGQSARFFVLVDGSQISAATRIAATVTAKTGSGSAGTVFAGAGDGGSDAVVGTTGAAATASMILSPGGAGVPSLVKSQSVFAPDGSTRAVRGAIVTYRLVANFPAAFRGAAIDDPIPAGTDYVPGSLALDDRPVTDARDTDAGTVDASGVHVALGDIAAAGTRTIQFSVKIQ